jgi:hypothetical protein
MLTLCSYIVNWNKSVTYLRTCRKCHPLPYLAFTTVPPGSMVRDIRLCLSVNALVHSTQKVVHFNRLSTAERQTLFKPGMSSGVTGKNRTFRTCIEGDDDPELVSAMIPYPETHPLSLVDCDALPKTCIEILMQQEVNVKTYLSDDLVDHFVFYISSAKGPVRAYGIERQQLVAANQFLPCSVVNSANTEHLKQINSSALTAVGLQYTINGHVPTVQIDTILYPMNTNRQYACMHTKYIWNMSKLRLDNREDRNVAQQWMGGSANNCGPGTERSIWIIEQIVCLSHAMTYLSTAVHIG